MRFFPLARWPVGRRLLVGLAVAIAASTPAAACDACLGGLPEDTGSGTAAFNFFNTPTAWDPGPNAARSGGHPAPGSATFSIVAAGRADVSGLDTHHGANLTVDITALAVPGFTFDDYVDTIDRALEIWDAASGFTNLGFVPDSGAQIGAAETAGGHLGDIRVAAWEITAASELARTFQPGTEGVFGAGGTLGGDLHLDPSRVWVDDPTDTTADADFDLFTVVLHELGHALGLQHTSVPGSVMQAQYFGARRTLGPDDLAGIQALYGVPEPSSIVLGGMALAGLLLGKRRGARRSRSRRLAARSDRAG